MEIYIRDILRNDVDRSRILWEEIVTIAKSQNQFIRPKTARHDRRNSFQLRFVFFPQSKTKRIAY